MRLALAQLNPLVGDLAGNGQLILEACRQAAAAQADLVLTPELSLWGYPPRDLLFHQARLAAQATALDRLVAELAGCEGAPAVLVGIAEASGSRELPNLYNALALVEGTGWRVVARKQLLPTYDVFDEQRYFRPGTEPAVLAFGRGARQWRLGLTICEDLWVEEDLQGQRLAGPDPVAALQARQVEVLINLSASPFNPAKADLRQALAARAAQRLGCPVVYVNQVGGNDELVFDGASFVVGSTGAVLCQLPSCREALELWSPASSAGSPPPPAAVLPAPMEQLFRALVLGVRDYAGKCGFQRSLLGLSGGIDSALVAVIASAALGPAAVRALLMPSPWSSEGSIADALALADRLGLPTSTLPIGPLMGGFDAALQPALGHAPTGLAAENLQSRIRGTLLMAVANQEGQLLLSTGNKSELAVGYCTLYGDMNGGLAVIGDLYKTTVFALADWLDSPASMPCRRDVGLPAEGELIGLAIRSKPPSAELRPDQRDSDSLPDYAELDPLLEALVEQRRSAEELAAEPRFGPLALQVGLLLRRAEFKRRQAAPVLKVSGHAFDSGWRMPIAAG
ncbi:NAD+ synthase [Cyanobium sp. NIES-981]|uniref:NAD+ synthase n=1 Tax=Cyanobium sp. NIES-981 TaxID=1851505 RepID=UPI0007DCC516|nr:NAD+ synthase [Cyanobium sp. NIES-981]SBO44529.1 putative glutamine-dependent NAD(+) synthetase [Cyanobium sp. NIES-981]